VNTKLQEEGVFIIERGTCEIVKEEQHLHTLITGDIYGDTLVFKSLSYECFGDIKAGP